MNVKISDFDEDLFRKIAFKKHGPKRGYIKKSYQEAIQEWNSKNKNLLKEEE